MEEFINEVKKKKTDRRVIKTKRAICNAFAKLLSQKSINEITVKDVADTADVNRKTVYTYYSGIHDILDEFENEIVGIYEGLIIHHDYKTVFQNPYEFFKKLTSVLCSDLEYYGNVLEFNDNYSLVRKIIIKLKFKLKEELSSQKLFEENKIDFIVTYTVSGMLSVFQDWYNSGRKESIEHLSQDVSSMVLAGIQSFAIKTK